MSSDGLDSRIADQLYPYFFASAGHPDDPQVVDGYGGDRDRLDGSRPQAVSLESLLIAEVR